MSVNYDIYVDVVNRIPVASFTSASQLTLPPLVQGETPNLRIFFVQPTILPTPDAPFDEVDYSSGYTFKVALEGTPGFPYGNIAPIIAAYQDAFSNITSPHKGIQAAFNLNHPEIATLLAGVSTLSSRFEVEITGADYLPIKVLDTNISVIASLIRPDLVPPVPPPTYTSITVRQIILPNLAGTKRVILYCGETDGKLHETQITD
jgi:hypothetical protein